MAMGVICLSTWFFVALVTDSSEEEVYFLVKKKKRPDLQFTCFKKFKSEDNKDWFETLVPFLKGPSYLKRDIHFESVFMKEPMS